MATFTLPAVRAARPRLPRLFVGLVLCGIGIALMVAADLGLSPWDVLHQGISERIGVPIGTVGILVGLVVLLLWIPLGERLGIGTLCNVVVIGATIDVALWLLPEPSAPGPRWAFLLVGTFVLGPGAGLYIGAGLGAGPRDGVMTALAARGHAVWKVRTAIEVAVLVIGYVLGGTVGVGTVLFALTIGPNVHVFLARLALDPFPHGGQPVLEVE